MTAVERREKKKERKVFAKKELEELKASLPMELGKFRLLFDYLEERLAQQDCDHTLKHTLDFLGNHDIADKEQVVAWLSQQGGYCDCEILYNVEEKLDSIEDRPREVPLELTKMEKNILGKKEKISELPEGFDFPFSQVSTPWKLSQKQEKGETIYLLQIGKGFNACIATLKKDFPKERLTDEGYYTSCWKEYTAIKSPKGLEVEILEKENYRYAVVKSKEYTPVLVLVVPKEQDKHSYLIVQTGLFRYKNDIKEIEKLLKDQ